MMTRVLIFFAVAVLAASTFGQNGAALASDRVYLIGPSDEITGKVLGESQFDFVVIVDEERARFANRGGQTSLQVFKESANQSSGDQA